VFFPENTVKTKYQFDGIVRHNTLYALEGVQTAR
jgi:hypothetical protein